MKPIVDEILAGEYQIDLDINQPIIFDIGANVGIFTFWALHKWPDCLIHCYEPSTANFCYLVKNFKHLKNVRLHNCAVGNPRHTKLYQGRSNCGQASFFKTEQQQETFEIVKTISPSTLPKHCDILKIDTEGCEVEILRELQDRPFKAILVEYHSEANRQTIAKLLESYVLVDSHETWTNQGVLKYLRS